MPCGLLSRRHFIYGSVGMATSTLVARAQQPTIPVVGFLSSASPGPFASLAAAFRQGLKEATFVEGRDVAIEYRWAEGKLDRLPALAADLVHRKVKVIAALGGDVTALAAKAATATIPIVFLHGSDPIKLGLVTSINRPGGNITGVSLFAGTVDAKRLALLHELVPRISAIAVLNNPLVAETEARSKALADVANVIGVRLVLLNASSENELDAAFATMADQNIRALFVSGSPFFTNRRDQLVALAARHKIPAIYAWRPIVDAGGLMSYGASQADTYRQAGIYVGRILSGTRPGDLPILQPLKIEFVINLTTAKALGLEIPRNLLALADEVIE